MTEVLYETPLTHMKNGKIPYSKLLPTYVYVYSDSSEFIFVYSETNPPPPPPKKYMSSLTRSNHVFQKNLHVWPILTLLVLKLRLLDAIYKNGIHVLVVTRVTV